MVVVVAAVEVAVALRANTFSDWNRCNAGDRHRLSKGVLAIEVTLYGGGEGDRDRLAIDIALKSFHTA